MQRAFRKSKWIIYKAVISDCHLRQVSSDRDIYIIDHKKIALTRLEKHNKVNKKQIDCATHFN